MKKGKFFKVFTMMTAGVLLLTGCGGQTAGETENRQSETGTEGGQNKDGGTELNVFIAASLSGVMEEVAAAYNADHPNVKINFNADSSGTLMTQIQEGFECDIFFSAAQKQMNELEKDGLIVEGTRKDVVNNQVCVVTYKGSDSKVTGLADIGEAESIALADGSVPVGKYTREAMAASGMLPETEDVSKITTQEISEALGGVEISEQGNVSKVRTAVIEGSCEVGTVYYSDTYGFEEDLEIIEKVSYDLTGNVIYPVCRIKNNNADDAKNKAADEFYQFIISDEAKAIFDKYLFDTNV